MSDTPDDYRRQEWEEENFDECPECGAIVPLGEPFLYGADADGNNGVMVREIDENHNCNEYLQESADARRESEENR